MIKKTFKLNETKIITSRFSSSQYNEITQEAEDKRMNNSEFIRHIWSSYKSNEDINKKIDLLEKRLEKRFFEMVSAVAGLDDQEYLKAKNTYLSKIKKGNE
ncbi:hypothetical protein [Marinomonas sp. ef1]|uniref:hypothetical protein n=1 Tax=Marinomonas sp. ef1 TaxID=2005043 RepID=UPI000C285CF3|nr:hypothetical protein [Marinomonas sp. ef1]